MRVDPWGRVAEDLQHACDARARGRPVQRVPWVRVRVRVRVRVGIGARARARANLVRVDGEEERADVSVDLVAREAHLVRVALGFKLGVKLGFKLGFK